MLYIGIDLGTSAVKLLLMESGGKIVKISGYESEEEGQNVQDASCQPGQEDPDPLQ